MNNKFNSYLTEHEAEKRLHKLIKASCDFSNGWATNPNKDELNERGYVGGYVAGLLEALKILYDVNVVHEDDGSTSYELKRIREMEPKNNYIKLTDFDKFTKTLKGACNGSGFGGLAAEVLRDNQASMYAGGEAYDRFYEIYDSGEENLEKDMKVLSSFLNECKESYIEGFRSAVKAFEELGNLHRNEYGKE